MKLKLRWHVQVITSRAALERKVRFPRFDDDVDKLDGIGKETAKKLRKIEEFVTTKEMVQKHGKVPLPEGGLLCVTQGTVGTILTHLCCTLP